MNPAAGQRRLYLETVPVETIEQLSLHLARQLPLRLTAGSVIVINERPRVFMSALRKRWVHIISEIEHQRSSTMDRQKRVDLAQEIERMQRFHFSTKVTTPGDALVTTWDDMISSRLNCFTLYLTAPIHAHELPLAMAFIATGGLLVQYTEGIRKP